MRRRRSAKRPRSWANRDALDTKTRHSHEKRQRRRHRISLPLQRRIAATHCDYKDNDRDGVEGGIATSEDEKEGENIDDAKENATEGGQTDPVFSSIFECPVCKQLLCNPVTLNCGHSLCEHCMMQYLMSLRMCEIGHCKCPAGCRTRIAFDLPEINITMRRALVEKYPSFTRERGEEINRDHPTLPNARRIIKFLQFRRLVRERTNEYERKVNERIDDQPSIDLLGCVTITWGCVVIFLLNMSIFMDLELLTIDWQKVREGQVWRLATGILHASFSLDTPLCTVFGIRSDYLNTFGFFYIRLCYLGNYEQMIGSKRFCITLISCALMILMWSYMTQEHRFCNPYFLAWYMFVQYCREKPPLFLALLFYDCVECSLNYWGSPFNLQTPWSNILTSHLFTLFSAFLFESATRWMMVAHFEYLPDHSQHSFLGSRGLRGRGESISLTRHIILFLKRWYCMASFGLSCYYYGCCYGTVVLISFWIAMVTLDIDVGFLD